MILRTGKKSERQLHCDGFSLIELLLALTVVVSSLVFLVGSLEQLSRFLAKSGTQIEALALGSGKILEWQEALRYGIKPSSGSQTGTSLTNSELEWRSEVSETELHNRLYQMDIQVFKRGRQRPTVQLSVQGWLAEPAEDES